MMLGQRAMDADYNATHVADDDPSADTPRSADLLHAVSVGGALCIVNVIIVFGNALVLYALYKCPQLQTRTNALVASLAVADFVLGVTVIPFQTGNTMFAYWPFHPTYCQIHGSFDVFSTTASILHICLIAMERFVAIITPMKYNMYVTERTIRVSLVIAWILSAANGTVIFIPSLWHDPYYDFVYNDPNLCALMLGNPYAQIDSVFIYFLPMTIVLIAYACIWWAAWKQTRRILMRSEYVDSNSGGGGGGGSQHTVTLHQLAEMKATRTLGIVILAFVGCWLPYFILTPLEASCHCVNDKLYLIAIWLGYANSAANPIIYSICNQGFRDGFKQILGCHAGVMNTL
ncbi:PREDICTED: beta-2 adrenergic receptor-like [Priapulus caudatus]|uniref:Beta-2 adrenergic receptor-like n=1 Tax=Priapulus caudatus TaxID=37621 RepID=A0ABM1E7X4_PRICU|nr:PREDICTED: beta-2 adrenergic receptor-like [Priapulus caudatus]